MAGRVVVITGAFGVLGQAVAKAAAGQGARVALLDFAKAAPAGLPTGDDVLVLPGVDLTDAVSAGAAMDAVADRFGGIDALLNIAGGFTWETLQEGSIGSWPAMYRLNVLTAANACRAAIPHLKRSGAGRIVNVGSSAALKAAMGMGAYAAAKAGVHSLTQALAEELKGDNITVNAVLPSILDTPTNRADMPDANVATWVAPADLAAVMLFLASEASTAVTGALLPVTGRV
ncbi:MAG: SDR family NAD(P)-dependent oxidoreductase [Alphaproteobacteria bacterium]|nr:SDR family NAD(P)-dependent oxidoreductase [Alphaproteobacteria bacterium]MBU1515857.1 SDR family NAD(P)-dependent oxidoreductase [Alphaproteobacteria bacterium]MBU2094079.1 SDR family NAD(P)-dependent oxidoreductase [Alphaproteobacteria bacterium]MBU2151431.1 SDR family NAD(P)-dependent oxidoreductase [Alphaproteobacteria bacterium]MBU2365151.1 SDR family NAD(P)-dependent oxidoreductase [Alphaproteobacteria bacterium]